MTTSRLEAYHSVVPFVACLAPSTTYRPEQSIRMFSYRVQEIGGPFLFPFVWLLPRSLHLMSFFTIIYKIFERHGGVAEIFQQFVDAGFAHNKGQPLTEAISTFLGFIGVEQSL